MTLFVDLLLAFALQGGGTTLPTGEAPTLDKRIVVAASEAGVAVAAYVAIGNRGADDRLIGVACACAERSEIHRIIREGGEVSMVTDSSVPVPAGSVVEIRPGSELHLMLSGMRAPLAPGATVELELRFERAGTISATFLAVEDSRAAWNAAGVGADHQP